MEEARKTNTFKNMNFWTNTYKGK